MHLRDVQTTDIPIFFEQHQDKDAIWMAAFTSPDPHNREAFVAHWERILANDNIIKQTIVSNNGEVIGSVMKFEMFGEPSIAYWIGKQFWGQGITTAAVKAFVALVDERPLFARVAHDNIGSIRVLEKAGFVEIGRDRGYANARQAEIEELIMRLN